MSYVRRTRTIVCHRRASAVASSLIKLTLALLETWKWRNSKLFQVLEKMWNYIMLLLFYMEYILHGKERGWIHTLVCIFKLSIRRVRPFEWKLVSFVTLTAQLSLEEIATEPSPLTHLMELVSRTSFHMLGKDLTVDGIIMKGLFNL